jgi:hypothetical protein
LRKAFIHLVNVCTRQAFDKSKTFSGKIEHKISKRANNIQKKRIQSGSSRREVEKGWGDG